VAGLLAVVAHSALGLAALLGNMAHGATVVALLANGAVLGQVTLAATRIARLGSAKFGRSTAGGDASASSGKVARLATLVADTGGASRSAKLATNGGLTVGGNGGSTVVDNGIVLGALLEDVTGLVALEASLLLGLLSAVSGHVAVVATVVANGVAHTGASSHLVTEFTAWMVSKVEKKHM
jgi:hypothetical protein